MDGVSFCNNSYDIFAGTGSDVDATGVNTFSDSDSADCVHTSGSGFVDLPATLQACGTAPAPAPSTKSQISLKKTSGQTEIQSLMREYRILNEQIYNDKRNDRSNFNKANYHGQFRGILNRAKALLHSKDESSRIKALRLVSFCYRALDEKQNIQTLTEEYGSYDSQFGKAAMQMKIPLLLEDKNFNSLLTIIDDFLSDGEGNDYLATLFYRGTIYHKYIRDFAKAESVYSRIVKEYPESAEAWAAQKRLNDLEEGDKEIQPEIIVPEEMEFAIKNYPNPANPGTTIQFSLPQDGHVSLTIYNVMGQKVSELANANMPKGVYNIRWNGMHGFGNAAASGMYFYRIVYENRILTNKFLLMR